MAEPDDQQQEGRSAPAARRRGFLAEDQEYLHDQGLQMLTASPKGGRIILWAAVLFFASGLLWASFAELDEVARGYGKVIPSRQVQIIQNLEGGIVAEILVQEGQVVERGDVLLKIDNTASTASFQESRMHYLALKARASRLRAEAEDIPCDPPKDVMREAPLLVEQEFKLFHAHQKELEAKLNVLEQQVTQRRQDLAEIQARVRQFGRSYDLVRRELELSRPLAKSGAIAEVEILRLERQANDLRGEWESAQLAVPKAEAQLMEAVNKKEELVATFRHEARDELNRVLDEIARLEQSQVALEDRVRRTQVRAPLKGTVKQLRVNTVGGVIQPGEDLVEIVPLEDTLVIEARISPADIAFITPDQTATVKFTAYDFATYGGMEAYVEHISADTITDEEGRSFYLVRVRTQESFFGSVEEPLPIIPGMTAIVDIMTGKKTVLEYLLNPVLRAKEHALRER